jgi:hypothetical protein
VEVFVYGRTYVLFYERTKSIAISIANIIIEIGQQHQECCMVILKDGIKSVTHRFFQEGHLKSGTFGINSGHRDILSKNGTNRNPR